MVLGSKDIQVYKQGVSTNKHGTIKQPNKQGQFSRKQILLSSLPHILKLQPA